MFYTTLYFTQHTEKNENGQWKMIRGKKRIRNSPEQIIIRKQSKATTGWVKPMYNSFEGFEEMSENMNNTRIKHSSFLSPRSLTYGRSNNCWKEIAIGKCDIKIINNEEIKIQSKSSIAYVNIMKQLKIRNIEFHTYKPWEELR